MGERPVDCWSMKGLVMAAPRGVMLFVLLLIPVSRCTAANEAAQARGANDFVTTTAWLWEHHTDTSLVIVDARDERAHRRGHIPGAVPSHWTDYADMRGTAEDSGYAELRSLPEVAAILARTGIAPGRQIVVYGDAHQGWGEEGQLVWLLRLLGVERARILDGGYPLWEKQDYPTTRDASPPRALPPWTPAPDTSWLATTDYLSRNLAKVRIIDTRTLDEYNGATPYGEARGGHIPHALHIHFKELYATNGQFLDRPRLMRLFEDKGVSADDTIVTYCTGGIRSGLMAVVLRMAGFAQARNYDGSFWAWAARKELPLE